MKTVPVLHTCLPFEVIGMKFSISTPFDRQSTVNKRNKRYEKEENEVESAMGYVHVRRTEPSLLGTIPIRLFYIYPTTFHVNSLYWSKYPDKFYHGCHFFPCL